MVRTHSKHAVSRLVPGPRGEQAILTTLSHLGPRVTVAILRLPTRAGRAGWGLQGIWAPLLALRFRAPPAQSTHHFRALSHAQPLACSPAGALARNKVHTTPEESGCTARRAAKQRLAGIHGHVAEQRLDSLLLLGVRKQLAQLRPPRLPGEVKSLDCRAEIARVLVQEPRSPGVG